MKMFCPPFVIWRWGGWFPAAIGCGAGFSTMLFIALLDLGGVVELKESVSLFLWFLIAVPFFLTFQRTQFDNDELIVRISFWIIIPLYSVRIPYAAVRGIGTDYCLVHIVPQPRSMTLDLFLYTRKRRAYLISRHNTETSYRRAVERIRKHVTFPVVRFDPG